MQVYTCILRDTAKRSAIQGLSQKRSVRAVVFDYGSVLCLEQTLEDMKGMALVCGIRHERFSELYWKLRPPYDRGDIDGPAYWTAVVGQQELGLSRDQIATLIKLDSESITRPNQDAVQWAKLLHHEGFRDVTPCRINRTRRAQRSPSSRSRTRESTTWWLREPRGTTSALWSTNNCRNCRGNHNCRLPGKQEVIPGGVWSFPPFHSYPRQISQASGANPSGNRLLGSVVKKGVSAAATSG
jgi:hypothetical protein